MKLSIITLILIFSLYASPIAAAQLSADDFLPPVQAQSEEAKAITQQIKQPDQVKKEEGIGGIQAVTAATAQDAVNAAVKFIPEGGGCEQIKFPSGFGWVATGTSGYALSQNLTATLIAQRIAYQKAYLEAKKYLASALGGLSTESQEQIVNEMSNLVDSQQELVNTSATSSEAIKEIVAGLLRGYVVYNVSDKQNKEKGNGIVSVTIVTSPKTTARYDRIDPKSLSADTLKDGLNQVLAEVSNGLMPPVGGTTITIPQTNEIAFVGFGSAIVGTNSNPSIEVKLRLEAQKIAAMRARSSLCGIILGDTVAGTSSMESSIKEVYTSFEEALAEDPVAAQSDTTAVKKLEQQRSTFVTTRMSQDQISSMRSGVLPPGVMVRTFMNEDGTMAQSLALYMPSATANANELNQTIQQTQLVDPNLQQTQAGSSTSQVTTPGTTTSGASKPQAPSQGATGQVTRDENL